MKKEKIGLDDYIIADYDLFKELQMRVKSIEDSLTSTELDSSYDKRLLLM
jgi:hypothetical protein